MPKKKIAEIKPRESTTSFHLKLPDSIRKQLEELYDRRRGRVSLTEIIIAALKSYLDPDEADKKEMALLKRLEAMDRHLNLLKTQNEAIAETLSVFIKVYITDMITLKNVSAVTPEMVRIAHLQTDAVYQKILERISANLNLGGEFFKNIPDQVFDPGQFTTREIEDGTIVDTEDEGNPDE